MSISIGSVAGYGNTNISNITDRIQNRFDKLDVNNNGSVERSEARSLIESSSRFGDLFAKFDADGNGSISQQEQSAAIEQISDKLNQFSAQTSLDASQFLIQQLSNEKPGGTNQNPIFALAAYQRNSF